MKLFTCPACQQPLHFENSQCTRCGHVLAFVPEHATLTAVEPVPDSPGLFLALGLKDEGARYRACGNWVDHQACNWTVRERDDQRFCVACRLNEIIPNLADPAATEAWRKLERSKRRLIYTLMALGLPIEPRSVRPGGLAFSFKQDVPGEQPVMIGHDEGLITINIAEADSPFREKTRKEMGETYRTLLGHFRHEIGHYYWNRLVAGSPSLEPFRRLFGDERASYEQALETHYRNGAPPDWPTRFVSSYASMHPWEDWSESWAHYLHMVDTLDTARSFGLALRPEVPSSGKLQVGARRLDFNDFDGLARAWFPVTVALNGVNRSMGLPDLYPFVLSDPALEKIRFVHEVVHAESRARLPHPDDRPAQPANRG